MDNKTCSSLIEELNSIQVDRTKNGKTQTNGEIQNNKVIDILHKHNFEKCDNKRDIRTVENGLYYVSQPNGSQKFPDFMLYYVDGLKYNYINLELKIGNKKIMWNDGFPEKDKNTIYLFSCTGFKKTVLFSSDIIDDSDYKLWLEYRSMIKELNKNKSSKSFNFYVRMATSQKIDIRTIKSDTGSINKMLLTLK